MKKSFQRVLSDSIPFLDGTDLKAYPFLKSKKRFRGSLLLIYTDALEKDLKHKKQSVTARYLCQLSRRSGTKMEISEASRYLNFACALGILQKDKITRGSNAKRKQAEKNGQRVPNKFIFRDLSTATAQKQINRQFVTLKDSGMSIRSISEEKLRQSGIQDGSGNLLADLVFPNRSTSQVTEEKTETKTSVLALIIDYLEQCTDRGKLITKDKLITYFVEALTYPDQCPMYLQRQIKALPPISSPEAFVRRTLEDCKARLQDRFYLAKPTEAERRRLEEEGAKMAFVYKAVERPQGETILTPRNVFLKGLDYGYEPDLGLWRMVTSCTKSQKVEMTITDRDKPRESERLNALEPDPERILDRLRSDLDCKYWISPTGILFKTAFKGKKLFLAKWEIVEGRKLYREPFTAGSKRPQLFNDYRLTYLVFGREMSQEAERILWNASLDPGTASLWDAFGSLEIHHKDQNPANSDPDNLVLLTPEEHKAIHDPLFAIDNESCYYGLSA